MKEFNIPSDVLFRGYCAAASLSEIPLIVMLMCAKMTLPDAGHWVDDRPYYSRNKPLLFVFVAILTVLVTARGLASILPRSRVVIAYNFVAHVWETILYLCCCWYREGDMDRMAYILVALMTINSLLFAARLGFLKHQEKQEEQAHLKWRQEQLTIIRQKRADYAKRSTEKKKA